MDKKELTKEVVAAMDNGALFGSAVATLIVGGITLALGGGLFVLFVHNAERFNRDYPGWDAGWDELKED